MGDVSTSVNDSVNIMVRALSSQTLDSILKCLAVLLVGILAIKLIMRIVNKAMEQSTLLNGAMSSIMTTVIRLILYFVLFVAVAGMLGIPITSFVALFSIVGLAISLAIQGLLSNLAGSMIIAVTKPFKLEDFVEAGTVSGTVKNIGIMYTQLQSPDGKKLHVPNSSLYTTTLINYTALGRRRVDLPISASYDNNPDQVEAAVMDAINVIRMDKTCAVLDDPAPSFTVEAYNDSAIDYMIRLWTPSDKWFAAKCALNRELYGAFARNHVEMTYPHLNVHMAQ